MRLPTLLRSVLVPAALVLLPVAPALAAGGGVGTTVAGVIKGVKEGAVTLVTADGAVKVVRLGADTKFSRKGKSAALTAAAVKAGCTAEVSALKSTEGGVTRMVALEMVLDCPQ
jgi:hypothetical protein